MFQLEYSWIRQSLDPIDVQRNRGHWHNQTRESLISSDKKYTIRQDYYVAFR